MIEATPETLFSTGYRLKRGGNLVGTVEASFWGHGGSIQVEGKSYQVRREGIFRPTYVLRERGKELARTRREGWLPASHEVRLGGEAIQLRHRFLGFGFDVLRSGSSIGRIARPSAFSRSFRIELPESMDLVHRVFLFWVAQSEHRRRRRAAS